MGETKKEREKCLTYIRSATYNMYRCRNDSIGTTPTSSTWQRTTSLPRNSKQAMGSDRVKLYNTRRNRERRFAELGETKAIHSALQSEAKKARRVSRAVK
jgi:hypothetical protein